MNVNHKEKLKTILKFDVGADGFMKMIGVLACTAILLLVIGIFFITMYVKEMSVLS